MEFKKAEEGILGMKFSRNEWMKKGSSLIFGVEKSRNNVDEFFQENEHGVNYVKDVQ